jgi:formimidoylglutamate deiminase
MSLAETSIWCRRALLASGWRENVLLRIDDQGTIRSITEGPAGDGGMHLAGPVVPGMPNLHSHGFQRLMAGLTGARDQGTDSFWGWREAMYAIANRLTPRQLGDCTAWLYSEMLCAGYTACAEFHYLHHQPGGQAYGQRAEMSLRVLAAADEVGIGLTLLPVLYQTAGFGKQQAEAQQARFLNSLDEYFDLLDDCRQAVVQNPLHWLGVAPHSLRAVPAESLARLISGLPDAAMPVHIHIAEQPAEVEDSLQALGARPVQWLLDHAPVDGRWCLVHATHMDAEERRRAAASGAVAGLCPTTEADLGDGYFETGAWLQAGGRFGVGSDSNLRVSVSEELRLLEFSARLRSGQRNVLRSGDRQCGRFLYEHTALAGARALGQPVGQLAPGLRADLVELDAAHPMLAGRLDDDVLESLVFAGGRDMVRTVLVAGRVVVEEGRHLQSDRLRGRFLETVNSLRKT